MAEGIAARLEPVLARLLGPEQPIRVRAWDGSETGPDGAPMFVVRDRRALRRLLWKPSEIGLVRAFVAGELDIEGDVYEALAVVQRVLRRGNDPIVLTAEDKRDIVRTAVMLGAVGPEPRPPAEEDGRGLLSETPPELYARMVGPGLGTGVGWWQTATSLEEAQTADTRDVIDRLDPRPGESVLEMNAGFATFARRLAERRPDTVVTAQTPFPADDTPGVRLVRNPPDETFDTVVSIAGTTPVQRLAKDVVALLKPGGRLLARQAVRRADTLRRPFTSDYVHGHDGGLPTLGEFTGELDALGLEVRLVRTLREDYARTLLAWARNLQAAPAETGVARVWLLHLATTALACENGRISVYEVEAVLR